METPNSTLDNSKELLSERFRIDTKDSGTMTEFYTRCYIQLMHTTAELEAKISEIGLLKKEIKLLQEAIKPEENIFDDYR